MSAALRKAELQSALRDAAWRLSLAADFLLGHGNSEWTTIAESARRASEQAGHGHEFLNMLSRAVPHQCAPGDFPIGCFCRFCSTRLREQTPEESAEIAAMRVRVAARAAEAQP